MNILVIGNGFDLAHGLPTRYIDFLEFIEEYNKYKNDFLNESDYIVCFNEYSTHSEPLCPPLRATRSIV